MNTSPRAFEPQRLLQTVRANARVLFVVTLLALFAGTAIARLAIPDRLVARAEARIARDPHLAVARVRSDELLSAAIARAEQDGSVVALRDQLRVEFTPPDRLRVVVHAREHDEAAARRVASALIELSVERANAATEDERSERARARTETQAREQAELERAQRALRERLASEGYPNLPEQLADARARAEHSDREAEAAAAEASAGQGSAAAVESVRRAPGSQRARAELADAQRALSLSLAQHGPDHPEVAAARQRLERLQGQTVELSNAALKERLASHAQASRARKLAQQAAQEHAELARLQQLRAALDPLFAAELAASERVRALALPARDLPALASVVSRADVQLHGRGGLRVLASLLAPLVALISLLGLYTARELTGFRVCAPSELAYWLRLPVLASSPWPRRADALETLVDELADPALATRGVALILPFSELERPLAATLAVQLNARAQRQYRSTTGSRVTIAQSWIGELGSSRIQRAAAAADRVLWVVAADAHRGSALRAGGAVVARSPGVAAILVDAEPALGARSGDAKAFWSARANERETSRAPIATASGA